jgi:hypothetical protein
MGLIEKHLGLGLESLDGVGAGSEAGRWRFERGSFRRVPCNEGLGGAAAKPRSINAFATSRRRVYRAWPSAGFR